MREQIEEIYQTHRRGLFALALCVTRSKPLAEDAVHEAFLKLCRSTRRPEGELVPYVFAAVRHAAIDIQRKQQRGSAREDEFFADQVQSTRMPVEQQLEVKEQNAILRRAILELDESSREAVTLKVFAGLTFDAIGEVTGDRPATVATRYRRALQTLEQRLRGQS